MKQIPIGSKVRVTGICITETPTHSTQVAVRYSDAFLRRHFGRRPAFLLNIRNLIILVGLLLAVVFAVVARGWAIERRVRGKPQRWPTSNSGAAASSKTSTAHRPLAEIVEEITELVSFKLRGAPCWCQIADGRCWETARRSSPACASSKARFPPVPGPPLGTLFAAFDPLAKPSADLLGGHLFGFAFLAHQLQFALGGFDLGRDFLLHAGRRFFQLR
jgi:hypothetical protein